MNGTDVGNNLSSNQQNLTKIHKQIKTAELLYESFTDIDDYLQIWLNAFSSQYQDPSVLDAFEYKGTKWDKKVILEKIKKMADDFKTGLDAVSNRQQLYKPDNEKLRLKADWIKSEGLGLIESVLEALDKIQKVIKIIQEPKSTMGEQSKSLSPNEEREISIQFEKNLLQDLKEAGFSSKQIEEHGPNLYALQMELAVELDAKQKAYQKSLDELNLECTKIVSSFISDELIKNIQQFNRTKLKKANTTNRSTVNKVKGLNNREQILIKAVYNQVNEEYKTAENNTRQHRLLVEIMEKIKYKNNNILRNKNSIMKEIRKKMNQAKENNANANPNNANANPNPNNANANANPNNANANLNNANRSNTGGGGKHKAPAKRKTAPAKRKTAPAKRKTATPAKRKTATPAKRKTATPAKRKTATPAKRKTATPAKRKTATPAKRKATATPAKRKATATPAKRKTATPAKRKATATPAKRKTATPAKRKTATPAKRKKATPAKRKKATLATKKATVKKAPAKKKIRKIYKGPQGGKYYISKGKKVYM